MLWRLWLSVLLGTAAILGSPPRAGSIQAAEPPLLCPDPSLPVRCQAVEFRLLLGRLELYPPEHRKGSGTAQRRLPQPLEESFNVTAERGIPSLHYVRQTPTQEWILDVVEATRVEIDAYWLAGQERFELTQPRRGPLVVRIRRGAAAVAGRPPPQADPRRLASTGAPPEATDESFTAASFLHLRATHPDLFARHLQPLLASLLPDLELAGLQQQTTAQLLELSQSVAPPDPARVHACVARLAAKQRQERERAQRELLQHGVAVIPLLDEIPTASLQEEQRLRLETIRRCLRPRRSDGPDRVAQWLLADPVYWQAIAADFAPSQRLLAERRLQRLDGRSSAGGREPASRVAQQDESSRRR